MTNYTVEEAAERLRKGRTWTWNAIRSGELKSFKIGARRLISEDALEDFIRSAQITPSRAATSRPDTYEGRHRR